MPDTTRPQAEALLTQALGQNTHFKPGQWEAINQIVNRRRRALVVQQTGWGKSMVYFISTALLRRQGRGPTLVISPLLALIRNQIEAAQRIGLRAETVNSTNTNDWEAVTLRLRANQIDLLIISPERFSNEDFITKTLAPIAHQIGLLVIDEAHCISDWGHDFRPDYRRIVTLLRELPRNMPVLATTATANERVVDDIRDQLGSDLHIERGPLVRFSLQLQALTLPSLAERLAWLARYVPHLPGSGIIYALTKLDAERVAKWLQQHNIRAYAYYSQCTDHRFPDSNTYREALEQALLNNTIKVLVATPALGMGFDKPDLGFVIHFQAPGSVVAYYQQVGRAGRAINQAYGILLSGVEDSDIHNYFRDTAFPTEPQIAEILTTLATAADGLTQNDLLTQVNLRDGVIKKVLRILATEPATPIYRDRQSKRWYVNPSWRNYRLDTSRINHLQHQREQEWAQIKDYIQSHTCLMEFLARALDDPHAAPCGHCAVCTSQELIPRTLDAALLHKAQAFLRHLDVAMKLPKRVPADSFKHYAWLRGRGGTIPPELGVTGARVLCRWGDPHLGQHVKHGKEQGRFSDELVAAAAELVRNRWQDQQLRWVTCIPSRRHPILVPDFASRLATRLGLPFVTALTKMRDTLPQKAQENRFYQSRNLDGSFAVTTPLPSGSALLVDDMTDSGWTVAVASALLRRSGCPAVYAFALATTRPDEDDDS